MMGLNPFDTMLGFGHPYRDMHPRHVRAPPRHTPQPSPRRNVRAPLPDVDIDLTEKAANYYVTVSAPVRGSVVDGGLLIEGALTTESDASFKYVTRSRAG